MVQARRKGKRTPAARRAATRRMHGWMMLAAGLAIGAVLTALVMGYPVGASWELGSGLRSLVERNRDLEPAAVTAPAVPDEPGDAGEASRQPHFDFYTVLPEIEYVMPDEPPPAKDKKKSSATAEQPREPADRPVAGAHYVLQAGSYAAYGDAERMRARLALSGLEAYVQRVAIEGKGVYFRVRLGPFSSRRELDAADSRLAREGIDAMRIRVTKPAPG